MFNSYNPAVTKLYTERFPWIGATNKAIVCTRKTAMTVELAFLLKRWLTSGKCACFSAGLNNFDSVEYASFGQKAQIYSSSKYFAT